jgi:hypothetical protein
MIDIDKYEELQIDDLDGAVTLFKSTDEGTETIAVFDEEHREVVTYLVEIINQMNDIEILEAWVKDLWRLLDKADENAAYEWAVKNIGEEDMHLVRYESGHWEREEE